MLRVIIFDRSPIFTTGLVHVLSAHGLRIVGARGEFTSELTSMADVLLFDPETAPPGQALACIESAARACGVLVLSEAADRETEAAYRASGAAGVIDRRVQPEVIVSAVRAVRPVSTGAEDTQALGSVALSGRERQVLKQIAEGFTHEQVARRLGISRHTVDTYVKRIRHKLPVGNKADLTRAALLGGFAVSE